MESNSSSKNFLHNDGEVGKNVNEIICDVQSPSKDIFDRNLLLEDMS